MRKAIPYDSDEGREKAGEIMSWITGNAYLVSIENQGRFEYEGLDTEIRAILQHKAHVPSGKWPKCEEAWDEISNLINQGKSPANRAVTCCAPTGTIGLMMDCETLGIEPEISLVKTKKLAGGGEIKTINKAIRPVLLSLGLNVPQVKKVLKSLEETEDVKDALTSVGLLGNAEFKERILSLFDCALPSPGGRCLSPEAHLKMLQAIQPHISMGISKTVNLPSKTTVDEIKALIMSAWQMKLKSIAVYRDGCKVNQPIQIKKPELQALPSASLPIRKRLPDERQSLTHKFSVGGQEGYLTVGFYEDGKPGELFVTVSKEGSTVSGMMDALATLISISLQHGVPLEAITQKLAHLRFEPSGFTRNKDIPTAKSIVDYIARWLEIKFLDRKKEPEEKPVSQTGVHQLELAGALRADAPTCIKCGALMVRTGTCYVCKECGETSGCS